MRRHEFLMFISAQNLLIMVVLALLDLLGHPVTVCTF